MGEVLRLALLGGAYTAQSVIANAQRCVNLYPEQNPGDSPVPVTHYQTPGLRKIVDAPEVGPGRGLYWASNNVLYCAIGLNIYKLDSNWQFTLLGTLVTDLTTPVSMIDNGFNILIVDGSANGYLIDLATDAFTQIVDVAFYGARRADYLDGFFVLNRPDTNQFYSSDYQSESWDPLYIAAKVGSPDRVTTLLVTHGEIWLFGEQYSTEVWYNSGAPQFPFARVQGAYVQYGCAAPYSVSFDGSNVFWLGQDRNGDRFVLAGRGYQAEVISTPALAAELAQYNVVNDAVAFCYQQNSHVFYVLSFPTADKTWVFDTTTKLWHEREYQDAQGRPHRIRPICHAYAYGQNVVLDWQDGTVFQYDVDTFTDNGMPIVRRRGFPHILKDGKRISHADFIADIETGTVEEDVGATEVLISLRWSDTRGHTWGNPVTQTVGFTGEYILQPSWKRLGMGRDRVYELFWSTPAQLALNGAYLTPVVSGT